MRYLSFIFVLTFLTSCSADMDWDAHYMKPKMVVYGWLTNFEEHQQIEVSRSVTYNDTLPELGLSGAEVFVVSQNVRYEFAESEKKKGIYLSVDKFAAEIGEEYRLEVLYDFDGDGVRESYVSSAKAPVLPKLDRVRLAKRKIMKYTYYGTMITTPAQSESSYWMQNIELNGVMQSDAIAKYLTVDVDLMSNGGLAVDDILLLTVNPWCLLADASHRDDLQDQEYAPIFVTKDDVLTYLVYNIDKGFHDFISNVKTSLDNPNPIFGGSYINLKTNIKGGAVGYFAVVSGKKFDVIVP